MSLIQYVLSGTLPPEVAEAKRKAYHRNYWHAHPEYQERDTKRKRERYASDPEYREKRRAESRKIRASMTEEQRAAERARRKARIIEMTEQEYQNHLEKQAERSKRWRQKRAQKVEAVNGN